MNAYVISIAEMPSFLSHTNLTSEKSTEVCVILRQKFGIPWQVPVKEYGSMETDCLSIYIDINNDDGTAGVKKVAE